VKKKRNEIFSVIIPAYNESQRILPTLDRISEYFKNYFINFEIIVVNDGSNDNTLEILLQAKNSIKTLQVTGYDVNKGKGFAIKFGVNISKGDFILISDADLSTPIEEVEKLMFYCESGYDIAIGSRALKESEIIIRQPWWREFMGKSFNKIVRIIANIDFSDTQCGFKLFRGEIGRSLFRKSKIDRFAYDIEILYLAKKEGYKIKEVPIKWLNSPYSKVKPFKDSLQCLKDLIKIKLIHNSA
jgi:dolichyl-phosphate beta-glucosyltransferase